VNGTGTITLWIKHFSVARSQAQAPQGRGRVSSRQRQLLTITMGKGQEASKVPQILAACGGINSLLLKTHI